MPEINPLSNEQIFLKKIAENTGSDYNTGDVSEINPITIDQILLKEIAANTAGQSGDITELEEKVTANAEAIKAMVNVNGCCNILDNNQPSETTGNITWTVNSDKTVTADSSGQTVSGLEHHEINHSFTLQPGTYKLSGGVDSNNYIELLETNYTSTGIIDTGNGYEFTVSSTHTYIVLLRSGNGVVSAEFKPMIHDVRLTPTGYVPYAMTNRELTESVTWHHIGYGSDDGGEVSCSLNYSEFIFTMITEGTNILQTIVIPVDQTGHQIYIMAYQSNTYNTQTRIAYDYSNSKFTFSREFLNGWNNIRIDVYAR